MGKFFTIILISMMLIGCANGSTGIPFLSNIPDKDGTDDTTETVSDAPDPNGDVETDKDDTLFAP